MNATDLWQALDAIKARYPLQLTLALVHFLWQGCAIAIVFAVTARLLRQAPASARYVAGVVALLLMSACLPVTLLVLPSPPTAAVDAAARPGAVPTPETTSPTARETAVILVRPDPAPAAMPASPGILSQTPTPAGVASGSAPIRQAAANRVTSILTWASPYTSGLYLCGVAVMLLHVALGLWGGRRLRDACIPATDGTILTRVRDHAHRLGMRVVPLVAYCRRISVPVVVGLLRPMILMPASLASGLTMRQVEAVLLHELAHIRRFDPAFNVLQRLVEAMLFFHPAVWWVSRRISAERESACDDLVLRSNYGRTEYADALVHVGELCTARSDRDVLDRAALAATGQNASQFKRRVLRLLDNNNKPAIRLTTTGVAISILLILSLLLAPAAWRSAARAEEETRADQELRIEAALKTLRTYRITDLKEAAWASAIRELILIGKPAVPKLIEELDRTEREETLRALGFVLRGIGDPRAVPGLVRAIPRTLQPGLIDFGLFIKSDPELTRFMQQHDEDPQPRSRSFSYGRPIREIMAALEKMTGQTLGWPEVNFVLLRAGPQQGREQRRLFLKLAERWADWWSKNWRKYVADEADAQLDLTRRALEQVAKSIAAAPKRPSQFAFPCGPNVTVGDGMRTQRIRSFDESPRDVFTTGFLDLDTGRRPCPPEELLKTTAGHEPSKDLLAWAEREGVDLVNIKITPPGSDTTFYAFKPLGMKVWRIENNRFANIQKELRESKKLELPAPWEGPLAQIDEKTGRYDEKLTVSFLFITKEGTCGAAQIQSPVSRELVPGTRAASGGGLHYEFIYEGSPKE